MAITLTDGVIEYDSIKNALINNLSTRDEVACTSPAGHCFASDGGTGIPENLKVVKGRGGDFEVWRLSQNKQSILNKYQVSRCQYCMRYLVNGEL